MKNPISGLIWKLIWPIQKMFFSSKNQKAVESSYQTLISEISKYHPIKLISQMSLTYSFVPEDKYADAAEEMTKHLIMIEFVTSFLLSKSLNGNYEEHVDGGTLEKIEKLFSDYRINLTQSFFLSRKQGDMLTSLAKINSLHVRGESFKSILLEQARTLYGEHDEWFVKKLGFNIGQCVRLFECLNEAVNKRINDQRDRCRKLADEYIRKASKELLDKYDSEDLRARVFCSEFFGKSDEILGWTSKEISIAVGIDEKACQNILSRLSQDFGYKNPNMDVDYTDPWKASWQYCSLYERPFILHQGKYILPAFSVTPHVLWATFNFDLMEDNGYRNQYSDKKGKWLELKVAECLRKFFKESELILNPKYPNGNEFCDVLVLRDRKVFILHCASKPLTFKSKIGADIDSLKKDLDQSIVHNAKQAQRAKDYLRGQKYPEIQTTKGKIILDQKQITDIFLVSVTLGNYYVLATRLAALEKGYGLFGRNEFPWSLSLGGLQVITEILDKPAQFIHYAKKRGKVEKTKFDISADEIDLLNYYLSQNLFFDKKDFEKIHFLELQGFSSDVDKYMIEKFDLGIPTEKPRQSMPEGFEKYLDAIEELEMSYKTDCALRLLDLGYEARKKFVEFFELAKNKWMNDRKTTSVTMGLTNPRSGISIVAMDAKKDKEKLFRQLATYSMLNKYNEKAQDWVGFGWDASTDKLVDVSFYASYDWFEDPKVEKLAKERLKNRKYIEDPNVLNFKG